MALQALRTTTKRFISVFHQRCAMGRGLALRPGRSDILGGLDFNFQWVCQAEGECQLLLCIKYHTCVSYPAFPGDKLTPIPSSTKFTFTQIFVWQD